MDIDHIPDLKKSGANKEKMPATDFTKGEPWRVFRIMAEFIDSFEQMAKHKNLVAVFGSARLRPNDPDYKDCVRLGELLANAGFGVLSGGGPGIMEAANRGAWQRHGDSVGLNIKLPMEQNANLYQTDSLDFRYFFIRKVCFTKYMVAAVAYPGGFGTLDEISEVLTLVQTEKINPIPIVLVRKSFWQPAIDWFRNTMLERQLISPENMDLFYLAEDADDAFQFISAWEEKNGLDTTVRTDV